MRYVDVQRRRAEGARSPRRHRGFWDDVWHDPYLSIAAGLAIVVTVLWLSVWWPSGLWGFFVVLSVVLVARGLWRIRRDGSRSVGPKPGAEKQLLMVLREAGGITPVEAALETSLTVDEAEEVLSRLATRGHLHVESHDGSLFYVMPDGRFGRR